MLTRLLVYFAYFLKSSPRYQKTKRFFYSLLEDPGSRLKPYFDVSMIAVVILSVLLLIYEIGNAQANISEWYERGVVSLFVIEYLLRLWLCSDNHKIILAHYEEADYLNIRFRLSKVIGILVTKKLEYISSPLAIIDLLAILPSYRELRVLRLFVIFRLFKLFRYLNSIKLFAEILSSKRFELYTLAIFLGFLIFIGSTALYFFENPSNGGQVSSLFDAFYLSVVTLATVGYGDIAPHTVGGRLVAMVLIFTGLSFIAFFTSIIVSAFSDKMQDMQVNRIYAELGRYRNYIIICGFGRVGQHIARQLEKDRQHFVVIDSDAAKVQDAKRHNYLAIHDDASRNDVLINAGLNNKATAILCTTGDDVINVYITLTSRHLNKDIRILSRANNEENVKKLYQVGATHVIQPFEIAGMVAAQYVGQPVAFEAIVGIISEEKRFIMETVCVHDDSFIIGQAVNDIDFAQRKLILVGVISTNPVHCKHKNRYQVKNQHFYFNPEKYFRLQAGDLLVVLGRKFGIDHFRSQVEISRLKLSRKS
ncbi:MAG: NAD-binding protein [Methylovulum sp.]|nr:NAD-binding protein [Methylovulum sp.]